MLKIKKLLYVINIKHKLCYINKKFAVQKYINGLYSECLIKVSALRMRTFLTL